MLSVIFFLVRTHFPVPRSRIYARRRISDSRFRVSRKQMTKPLPPEARLQSLGEEIANSLSSGIGLMTVIAGIPLLVGSAPRESRYICGMQVREGVRDRFSDGGPKSSSLLRLQWPL
jgi:hypothetical protein